VPQASGQFGGREILQRRGQTIQMKEEMEDFMPTQQKVRA
jgi:hypothetical protein